MDEETSVVVTYLLDLLKRNILFEMFQSGFTIITAQKMHLLKFPMIFSGLQIMDWFPYWFCWISVLLFDTVDTVERDWSRSL